MDESYSIEQAASLCGVSAETIRRRLRADLLPGATRVGPGRMWLIPKPALRAVGLLKSTETERHLEQRAAQLEAVCAERQARIEYLEAHIAALLAALAGNGSR